MQVKHMGWARLLSLQPGGHFGAEQPPPSSATSAAQSCCSAHSGRKETLCRKPGELYNITCTGVPELRTHPPLSISAQQTPWQQWPGRPAVCATPQGLQTHGWIYTNKCIIISAFIAQTSYKEWEKNIVIKRQYSHQKHLCLAAGFFFPQSKSHQGPDWVRAVCCCFPSS